MPLHNKGKMAIGLMNIVKQVVSERVFFIQFNIQAWFRPRQTRKIIICGNSASNEQLTVKKIHAEVLSHPHPDQYWSVMRHVWFLTTRIFRSWEGEERGHEVKWIGKITVSQTLWPGLYLRLITSFSWTSEIKRTSQMRPYWTRRLLDL